MGASGSKPSPHPLPPTTTTTTKTERGAENIAWTSPQRLGEGAVPGKFSSQAGETLGTSHKPNASWEPGASAQIALLGQPKGDEIKDLLGRRKLRGRHSTIRLPCDPLPLRLSGSSPRLDAESLSTPPSFPPPHRCWRLEREGAWRARHNKGQEGRGAVCPFLHPENAARGAERRRGRGQNPDGVRVPHPPDAPLSGPPQNSK